MKIIVTGGASGLGAAITEKLAAVPGYEVIFTYCSSEEKAKAVEARFPNTRAIRCDFTDLQDVEKLAGGFSELSPDVLINNAFAGGITKNYFHKTDAAVFSDGFSSNVMPVVLLTQAAISIFRKKKSGKIITILSSAIVNKPPIGWSSYVAAKNYLLSLSKSWAVENARYNISSNAVSPSFMQTQINADVDERMVEEMINNHPLKRLLQPEEVADTVAYLVAAGNQVNGINFLINAAENVI